MTAGSGSSFAGSRSRTWPTSSKRRAFRHVPDAALAAYAGLPAVLVWDSEKA
jgi:hypothetical protein